MTDRPLVFFDIDNTLVQSSSGHMEALLRSIGEIYGLEASRPGEADGLIPSRQGRGKQVVGQPIYLCPQTTFNKWRW